MTPMTVDRIAAGSVTGVPVRPGPRFLTAPLAARAWRADHRRVLAVLRHLGV